MMSNLKMVEVKLNVVIDLDDGADLENVVKNLFIGDGSNSAYILDSDIIEWEEIESDR